MRSRPFCDVSADGRLRRVGVTLAQRLEDQAVIADGALGVAGMLEPEVDVARQEAEQHRLELEEQVIAGGRPPRGVEEVVAVHDLGHVAGRGGGRRDRVEQFLRLLEASSLMRSAARRTRGRSPR